MEIDHKRHLTFPLRLPVSVRDTATELAHRDGVSLNHFISLAVAEKISRLEQGMITDRQTGHPKTAHAPGQPLVLNHPSLRRA